MYENANTRIDYRTNFAIDIMNRETPADLYNIDYKADSIKSIGDRGFIRNYRRRLLSYSRIPYRMFYPSILLLDNASKL